MKKTLSVLLALAFVLVLLPTFAVADGDVTTVVWYMPDWFNTDSARLAQINQAANEILAADGLAIDLRMMESGEYGEKVRLMSASGEECDMLWMGYLTDRPSKAWKNGMLMSMQPYTAEVPELMEILSIYQNGENTDPEEGLYAVPCLQIMAGGMGMLFRKDIVDQYNLYDACDAVQDWEDLSDLLLDIKANYLPSDMYVITRTIERTYDYDHDTNTGKYFQKFEDYFYIDPDTLQVRDEESNFEYELKFFKTMRAWQEAGFFHPDILTISDTFSDLWATNLSFTSTDTYKPGGDVDWFNRYGVECLYVTYCADVLDTGWATQLCLPYQSKHPQEAMKVIEKVYTNQELFNIITNGLEGIDYVWADEDHIQQLSGCYQTSGWAVGNQFLQYPMVGQAADVWEQTKAINNNAYHSALMEFSFDSTPVQAELANVKAVFKEYDGMLNWGLVEDVEGTLRERYDMARACGYDAVVAELNAQINAFLGR